MIVEEGWFFRRPIPALAVISGKAAAVAPAAVEVAAVAAGTAAEAVAAAGAVAVVSLSGFPDSPARPEPPRH